MMLAWASKLDHRNSCALNSPCENITINVVLINKRLNFTYTNVNDKTFFVHDEKKNSEKERKDDVRQVRYARSSWHFVYFCIVDLKKKDYLAQISKELIIIIIIIIIIIWVQFLKC
jgi:hypothetical protein